MNRRVKLEDYLNDLVSEQTEPFGPDSRLLVTDAQLNTVGRFFLEGMVGLIESLRTERSPSRLFGRRAQGQKRISRAPVLQEEFIN